MAWGSSLSGAAVCVCSLVRQGAYRFLYIFNWIWRAAHTPGYQDWIVWISGFIQSALYGDFFYYYIKCKYYGEGVKLPQ